MDSKLYFWLYNEPVLYAYLTWGSLITTRIATIVAMTPFLGGYLVPAPTKIAISLGLSLAILFMISPGSLGYPNSSLLYYLLIFKELVLGFIISFVSSEFFYIFSGTGQVFDMIKGSNFSETQIPETPFKTSATGQIYFQLLLFLFCSINGHHLFFNSLTESFRLLPVNELPSYYPSLLPLFLKIFEYSSDIIKVSFSLIFPGLLASMLTDIFFGTLNRIAPQLNAYFMAMGIKALTGTLVLLLMLSILAHQFVYHLGIHLKFLYILLAI